MTKLSLAPVFGLLAAALAGAHPADPALPSVVQFNRDVRPIMANTCFKCHGQDPKANKADLRLDLPENARLARKDKSGRTSTPIVPGNPDASEAWRRISSADPNQVMPPPDSLHLLTARDKAILRRWIEQGAVYEPHWAYIPPRKAEPPGAGIQARNPIDRFVRRGLEERGLAPSPEADRRTLIRRLSLDLLGLPPSVEETEAFVSDARPDAYERLVGRLLDSPHYGERMAVAWLDLTRFADTVGYHGDQLYNNFPYRDYVIDAFNRDEPFDQFTREQIAGDLIAGATIEQRVASGFNRLNMVTREGGAQPKEYLARYMADRVRTVSTVWLGSTMACCECHDHKFDPYKTRDFYSMGAFFADVQQWGVYENYTYTPEPELKGLTNDSPFPPEIEVDSPYLKKRAARLRDECQARVAAVARAIAADPASAAAAREWAGRVAPLVKADPAGWTNPAIVEAKPKKDGTIRALPDQSARFEPAKVADPNAYRSGDGAIITLAPAPGTVATARLDVMPDPAFNGRVTNGKDASFTLTLELAVQRPGQEKPEAVKLADAYPNQPTNSYFNGRPLTSLIQGWTSTDAQVGEPQSVVYVLAEPMVIREGDRLIATVESENVGRFRLSLSPLGVRVPGARPPDEIAAALCAGSPTPEQAELLAAEYFKGTGAAHAAEFAATLGDVRDIAACREGRTFMTVTVSTVPRVTRILPRGNWQDESGATVLPSPPGFLGGGKGPAPDAPRLTRLDLANWLVSRDNPLTARAFVNRLWKQYFGTGLSAVVDDLGTQGEYPSHPELLDWLAVEFMDRGWDVKAMVREMVGSATYRQRSANRPELAEIDPNNRLLARQTPRRLEAEFVRDNALAAAGLIDLEIGGPSVYPYQPEGYYSALQYPDRVYVADTDEREYRRGVYMHWQRTFLHPMLANFDAPSREECTAARVVSSTPQQALTLLNDPEFVEAARGLAEKALADQAGTGFGAGLDDAFRRLLARSPSAREQESLQQFFEGQLAYYRGKPDEAKKVIAVGLHAAPAAVDPATLAAWISVARVLLNLNETIVRY
ncbi:MAG TPA: PSD1 and planctomycete cytochrome C domain-containing protein [Opitutaceae bacterium]|nr:PSD1 and planctomycete cytochrome C domain-containing protein [Opitutaceae bacterium]